MLESNLKKSKCSNCKQEGHPKSKCENPKFVKPVTIKPNKKVLTEDLGKKFEMSICLHNKISYDGKFKYDMDEPNEIKDKLAKLKDIFPYKLKHTAKGGSRYDFIAENDNSIHLSAKTTKGDGKVCPQVIGQPSKKRFCEHFALPITSTNDDIKKYIVDKLKSLLKAYFDHTFDSNILYYNKKEDKILLIKKKHDIDWTKEKFDFSHIRNKKDWNESTTLMVISDNTPISIGEFQIHNHRSGVKFRWQFENFLVIFEDYLEVIKIN